MTAPSRPRVTIVGGGSSQWTPKLLVDFVNTPVVRDAEVVLHDIDPASLPRMVELAQHLAAVRGVSLTARGTTDRRDALVGADFVVANISTGGFRSMRHDLEIPERYGIRQSVGDTVGPGGVMRSLRNIPVFLDIARDVEAVCPDAWILNLTNPMTTICRALTRETPLKVVGLCHEVTVTQFLLGLLLDVGFLDLTLEVGGVNHLPLVTRVEAAGDDGLARLRALLDDAGTRGDELLPLDLPEGLELLKPSPGPRWTRGDLLANWRVKLELFARFGVLPAAGDRHLAEFFPNFITEQSDWGARWGFGLTGIATRERHQHEHVAALEAMLASDTVDPMPSGEMVAPVMQCMLLDRPGRFPLNIPNDGQVADLPLGAMVESMCIVDAGGVRGDEGVSLPAGMAEVLRRVSASQELTVEAGVSGERDAAFAAMLLDPLAGRLDYDALSAMTDELLAATAEWLPQFPRT
jgi:alpha-galactosidase/6-phospho-beta-glucosidase family protein